MLRPKILSGPDHGRSNTEPDTPFARTRFLRFYGGVLIVRTRANEADYAVLEKDGLITALSLGMSQVKYKITKAGRAALST